MRQPSGLATCLVIAAVLAGALPVAALVDYLVIDFSFGTVHVIGSAMSPTVDAQDYLVTERLPYRVHAPERGDVVIARSPLDPGRDIIKRVVGLPGDRFLVRDCRVYVDRWRLAEPYVNSQEGWRRCDPGWPGDGRERTLASDEFFVMGDNRDHSSDSRTFGPVERSQIEARAGIRVLPLDHFGGLPGQRPHLTSERLPAAA